MKTLDEIPRKNPFKIPENYFEEVNRRIIASTADKEKVRVGLYHRLRPYLIAAASVAIFAVLSYTAAMIFLPVNRVTGIPELTMEEFSSSYLNDIDISTLEERADAADFSDKIPAISKPEIVDYLLFENINLNDIYEIL
jgi:hypothetical protein